VEVVAGVGEEGALAAVDPAAVDEQRLVAVVERRPLQRLLFEVELGNAIGDPIQELEAISVAFFMVPGHVGCIVIRLDGRRVLARAVRDPLAK
jgi:hypothetical protein